MRSQMWCQIIVSCLIVFSKADQDYENTLTKLWSISSAANSDGPQVFDVTSASIVIQPNYGDSQTVFARKTKDLKESSPNYRFRFKPRAIPLQGEQPQVEKNVYYSQNDVNDKYKTETLFPGNYPQIAKEKSNEDLEKETLYNPSESTFYPKTIPLISNPEFQGRSLDLNEEPIIEKPEEFSEHAASRRSLSYVLGAEDDDEDPEEEEEELEDEIGDEVDGHKHSHNHQHEHLKKKLKKKTKKMTKYMMPLLLAYKLKYFALVPVMISGLVLLIGATGLAGFFFALFAAVMGLQKGGY